MRRLLLLLAAALVLAPPAGAWTRLTPDDLPNIVKPSPLRLEDGHELVAYDDATGAVKVIRVGGGEQTVVSGYGSVGEAQLLVQKDGTLLLYFPGTSADFKLQGVLLAKSSDGGASWSAPEQTASKDLADVSGAALRPDGTPLFSQDGTGFVNVYQGLHGEEVHNVFPACCGYAESLAVDSTGRAQVAFWSNASQKGFLYGSLDGSGGLAGGLLDLSGGADTVSHNDRVPLVADGAGNTFAAWAPGYPTSSALMVATFRNGVLVRNRAAAKGSFAGADPHMALAVDPAGRLWVAWTQGGALHAARSRTAGASFGAAVSVPDPSGSTIYQLEAAAGADGLEAFANLATSGKGALWLQHLLPGLTVKPVTVARKGKNGKTVLVHFAKVLDDGFPVPGAKLAGGGATSHTNGQGLAPLAGFAAGKPIAVTASGYTATSFRAPRQ